MNYDPNWRPDGEQMSGRDVDIAWEGDRAATPEEQARWGTPDMDIVNVHEWREANGQTGRHIHLEPNDRYPSY
jgi:hypothetical protein